MNKEPARKGAARGRRVQGAAGCREERGGEEGGGDPQAERRGERRKVHGREEGAGEGEEERRVQRSLAQHLGRVDERPLPRRAGHGPPRRGGGLAQDDLGGEDRSAARRGRASRKTSLGGEDRSAARRERVPDVPVRRERGQPCRNFRATG